MVTEMQIHRASDEYARNNHEGPLTRDDFRAGAAWAVEQCEAEKALLVKAVEMLEAEKAELLDLVNILLQAESESARGICDCIDNDGKYYQSAHLAGILARMKNIAEKHKIKPENPADLDEF